MSTPTDLAELADAVVDEASFVRFLSALSRDFAEGRKIAPAAEVRFGLGARGWENVTVDSFLEAATAWATDTPAARATLENPWHRAAAILLAGKSYE
jgi:hypothetical protein